MAKRFTDTEKFERPWFRALSDKHKLLWLYILDRCDVAGVWYEDFQLANFLLGYRFNRDQVILAFDKQIKINGNRWLIKDFIAFQYGGLNPENRLYPTLLRHLSAFESYQPDPPHIPHISPICGGKDKEQDKDKGGVKSLSLSLEKGGVGGKTNPQADFIQRFQVAYEGMTGQPFSAKKEHFVIVANLIRKHGLPAVEAKMNILGFMCRDRTAWFTKDGWADFTIEKLSRQWNSIIPQSTMTEEDKSKQRMADLLRKENEKNERINKAVGSK